MQPPRQVVDKQVVARVLSHHLQVALPSGECIVGQANSKKEAKQTAARSKSCCCCCWCGCAAAGGVVLLVLVVWL